MASCVNGTSVLCADDGKSQKETPCDPLQGASCDSMTGLCVGACTPENIGQSYFGCDYFPTLTNNQLVSKIFDFAVAVSNTTAFPVTLTVTRGPTTVNTATLAANSVQILTLPWIDALDQQVTQRVVDGAYRLRSTRPVTVYQYNPLQYLKGGAFSYTNDASLLLPVNVWTGNYRVVSRNHWVFGGSHYGGLYAVTASQDKTTVNVTPSPTGGKVLPGAGIGSNGVGTVTLDAGDVLQVFTASAGGAPDVSDLTGTLIAADKPVQVIGGHLCTNIPYSVVACDHIEESIPPLETLATDYIVTAPLITPASTKVRMVRIVSTVNATTLTYDPPYPGAPPQLGVAGSYAEIPATDSDFGIHASHPILVAEYFTGQQQGGGSGDPAMALAVQRPNTEPATSSTRRRTTKRITSTSWRRRKPSSRSTASWSRTSSRSATRDTASPASRSTARVTATTPSAPPCPSASACMGTGSTRATGIQVASTSRRSGSEQLNGHRNPSRYGTRPIGFLSPIER